MDRRAQRLQFLARAVPRSVTYSMNDNGGTRLAGMRREARASRSKPGFGSLRVNEEWSLLDA